MILITAGRLPIGPLIDFGEGEALFNFIRIKFFYIIRNCKGTPSSTYRLVDIAIIKQVKDIIARLPLDRQNILFSATMPKDVMKLIHTILKNHVKVEVEKSLESGIAISFCSENEKVWVKEIEKLQGNSLEVME